MANIVKQLRTTEITHRSHGYMVDLALRAADEIERLEQEVVELRLKSQMYDPLFKPVPSIAP